MEAKDLPDLKVMFPSEYIDILMNAMEIGIDRVKTDPRVRQQLKSWWEVEKEFIGESRDTIDQMYSSTEKSKT